MPVKAGEYANLLTAGQSLKWTRPKGEPKGTQEVLLNRHKDGRYTHLLRIKAGVEMKKPVVHDFYEEAYYIDGEMLNTKDKRKITGGDYVFHKPGEEHGPFRCLKTCLILEFRYYK